LGEHPFEGLAGDQITVGTAEAGDEDDFGVDRRDDARWRDRQLRAARIIAWFGD
jgi:hypothetical protein